MQLTRFTDMSLRILMYLAHVNRARLVTAQELSEKLEWSPHLLVKIVNRLSHEGLVEAVRGRKGGIQLAEGAEKRRIGGLVRLFEGTEPLIDCSQPACTLRAGCALGRALHDAQEAFFASLDAMTIEDAVRPPELRRTLSRLNGIPIVEVSSAATTEDEGARA